VERGARSAAVSTKPAGTVPARLQHTYEDPLERLVWQVEVKGIRRGQQHSVVAEVKEVARTGF
jgi:hypothetical protein